MAYPGLAREEHKYLGKEYCTGYTDVDGKWNTGFYCPQYGSKTAVFCCGTAVFKYCCTNQEPVDSITGGGGSLLDGDDPNFGGDGVSSAVFVRVPIVFGVVCGIAAVLILLVVAACYFCSCCFAYKKRRDDPRDHHRLPTSLYRASNSTTSNLLNLYSPAALTANSLVTTPLDLDWALAHHASGPSSIASSYQSQQFYPNLFQNPALAAAALSHRSSHSPSPSSLLYSSAGGGGGQSTPSVISGNTINNRYPPPPQSALSAYHNFLNSSTSTLSSRGGVIAPPAPPPTSAGLHRGNLPQQISTTASIVNSYLASLQQAQAHNQIQGHSEPPPQHPPSSQALLPEANNQSVDHPRHPSPPPPYSQIGPPYQNGNGNRNNRNNGSNNQPSNRALMATIQSVLGRGSGPVGGGPGTGGTATISGNCSSEDELASFLLRNEDYLRRALRLGVPNNNNNNTANNRNINNTTATNNQNNVNNNNVNNANSRSNPSNTSRGSSNPMLTQRELIELLLRLTYSDPPRSSSGGGSVSRSESRAGSDSAISVTSRSTTSSVKSGGTSSTTGSGGVITKLTISEVDEEDERLGMMNGKSSDPTRLDVTLSRISDNDSGVPSSGSCSTTGSEASAVIGSIKVFSRDMSEEAVKLKKQHAVDDDGDHHHHLPHHRHPFPSSCDPPEDDDDLVGNKKLHHQQQLAAIHPETNCTSNAPTNNNAFSGGGGIKRSDGLGGSGSSDGEVIIESSSSHSPSSTTLESSDDQQSNGESVSSQSESPPTVPRSLSVPIVPCENAISSTAQVTQ